MAEGAAPENQAGKGLITDDEIIRSLRAVIGEGVKHLKPSELNGAISALGRMLIAKQLGAIEDHLGALYSVLKPVNIEVKSDLTPRRPPNVPRAPVAFAKGHHKRGK